MAKTEIIEAANNMDLGSLDQYEVPFNDARDKCPQLKKYAYPNSDGCYIYYPENITPDTKVNIYVPGGGGMHDEYSQNLDDGRAGIFDYLMEYGNDQIIIMPNVTQGDPAYERATLATLNAIEEQYGIKNTSHQWSGYSHYTSTGLETAAAYIKSHPEAGPQVFVGVEGYRGYSVSYQPLINDIKDDFINSGSVLIALDHEYRTKLDDWNYADAYADAGINVVRVVSHKFSDNCDWGNDVDKVIDGKITPKYGSSHHTMIQNYFKDGIIDFELGEKLPTDGYTYQVRKVDENGNPYWADIDVSEIDTYDKLLKYFGNEVQEGNASKSIFPSNLQNLQNLEDLSIETEDQSLATNLNNIRGTIRKTSFVNNSKGSFSFTSSTQVPSSIPEIVLSYFTSNATVLSNIVLETDNFVKINDIFKETDKKLKEEAEEGTEDQGNDDNGGNDTEDSSDDNGGNDTEDSSDDNGGNDTDNGSDDNGGNDDEGNDATPPQNSGGGGGGSPAEPDTDFIPEPQTFPMLNFDELKTNDKMLVYKYSDNCKIVIHIDNDKILGIEHYYNFGSKNDAANNLSKLYSNYGSSGTLQQNDQYVKVSLNINNLSNINIASIKNRYKDLELI